jgi:hypothetical protein
MDALEQLKVNVVAVEASVAKNTGDICDLQKEVKGLKQQLNARDQENRANVLRLTGFPYVKEEKGNRSVLQKAVFDRILKPILDAAVSNGQIAPPTKQLEFDCFRVGRWPPPRVPGSAAAELYVNPPPIVIKFADLDLRTTVLRNKRLNMPKPSEEERRLGGQGVLPRGGPDSPHLQGAQSYAEPSRCGEGLDCRRENKVYHQGGQKDNSNCVLCVRGCGQHDFQCKVKLD